MWYNKYIKHILNRRIGDCVYEKGDLIIYGKQGVCRIENIGIININKKPSEKEYYTLNPVFMDGKTYVPVDTSIYMRHLITLEEVKSLLSKIPDIETVVIENKNIKQLTDYYKKTINEYTCDGLLQLICNLQAKQKLLSSQKKQLGQTEQKYKKEAEDLLHQEFAAVLNVSQDEVIEYFAEHIK